MKVLFVGEGKTDIGPAEFGEEMRTARGTVFVLSRKVVPAIDDDSPAIAWTELVRFHPSAKKKGVEAKVAAAILISVRRLSCEGTVCVTDCEGDLQRLEAMNQGREKGLQLVGGDHPCVCGLAVESIEAWTLGAPEAMAECLEVEVDVVGKCFPKGKHVEELSEKSGKEEHHPKPLLKRIAQIKHRFADVEFREEVAARTEVDWLEEACPKGFQPFAKALREAFPQPAAEGELGSEPPMG